MSTDTPDTMEDLDSFRARARAFIRGNLKPATSGGPSLRRSGSDEEELAEVARDREIQRMLFDAGLAGLCVPRAYGGQGLTPAHQVVLNEELAGYEYPSRLQSPTFAPILAVLVDHGTEEQKQAHIPAILKGEEIWMQFLSEPQVGSDLAGVLTTATRDGDEWIMNGSKIWTTGAWWSDWGLCLARTNWDVPKHRGLTVFMLPLKRDGIEVHRIEMLNGNKEFCQEFFTDVRIPDSDRVSEVDDGWSLFTSWMFHERMLYNSPYVTVPKGAAGHGGEETTGVVELARDAGVIDDPHARDLVGESLMLDMVGDALKRRIVNGIVAKAISDQASAISRLAHGVNSMRHITINFELVNDSAAAWAEEGDASVADIGNDFLMRQVSCIGGGTTEMARNVIAERVLGMPRDVTNDRDIAFREVPRGKKQV